ncbi:MULTISPECIES: 3-keto-5-aminohexanoate cleavage protein [Arthrobacter]|uniref:3-keto-5-aminohexanoate cleavage protein n=1 Tax=Arthrobacter terricola TaxID=2547396 RepID=A0A4R5K6M9_9MICC|nr:MULTISPECIES: 3-keto-5-aminohexanoate cleavage protein [Arthrobacter]MBT8163461.1 3-keto-5-aminohexanoate cleavage protein [Arthrobacter sp. GN70]TDF89765.1 3-keto-5-aminohexanoate cleavage protein [Arthrobacter terricola]
MDNSSSTQTPLIIEIRSNEMASKELNPAIPYGPQEVVSDALSAVEAGASMIHWHARDIDGAERPGETALYREVVEGIRSQSDVLLHPTLGFIGTQNNAESRIRHILELNSNPATKIDIVPVDFGAFIADTWLEDEMGFASTDGVLMNRTGYLEELLGTIHENTIKVMSVVWSAGAVRTARIMQRKGLLASSAYWQFGFTGDSVPGGPPPTLANLHTFLEAIPQGDPWTIHVRDGDGFAMALWAITLGGHVSIGLGDNPYSRLGHPDNSGLVRRIVNIAESLGRPVATIEHAREIIGV